MGLSQVSYLVLDEADRMLDQGFERDIRQIVGETHKGRQTALFSATWPDSVRELAHSFLNRPIKVTIGSEDLAAGTRITQIVEVVEDRAREGLFQKLLNKYHSSRKNRVLIFALYKKEAARLETNLKRSGWKVSSIHGDKSQDARTQAVEQFKSGEVPLLVATDVAAQVSTSPAWTLSSTSPTPSPLRTTCTGSAGPGELGRMELRTHSSMLVTN